MVKDESLPGPGSTRTSLLSDVAVGFIEDRTGDSISTTLDYAVADFGIAQFAKELGETAEAEAFMTRAQHWQNLVSSKVHAIVPRDRSGYWSGFNLADRNSAAKRSTRPPPTNSSTSRPATSTSGRCRSTSPG